MSVLQQFSVHRHGSWALSKHPPWALAMQLPLAGCHCRHEHLAPQHRKQTLQLLKSAWCHPVSQQRSRKASCPDNWTGYPLSNLCGCPSKTLVRLFLLCLDRDEILLAVLQMDRKKSWIHDRVQVSKHLLPRHNSRPHLRFHSRIEVHYLPKGLAAFCR